MPSLTQLSTKCFPHKCWKQSLDTAFYLSKVLHLCLHSLINHFIGIPGRKCIHLQDVLLAKLSNLKFICKHCRFNVQSCHILKEMYFHSFFPLIGSAHQYGTGQSFDQDIYEKDFTFGFLFNSQQISKAGIRDYPFPLFCILSPPGKNSKCPLGKYKSFSNKVFHE